MTKKRIVGVIGLGHVGAHVAYALAVQGIADELILVDQKEQKLASEVQDLRDAAARYGPVTSPIWASAMSSSTAWARSSCWRPMTV